MVSATPAGSGAPVSSAPALERPRVLLYSHDGTGLGHLRIVRGITVDLAERRPDASLLLVTGSLQANLFEVPPNVDYLKLPAVPKRLLYAGLPARDAAPTPHKHVIFVRNAIIRATVEAFRPHVVVIDHAPAGLFRELAESLAWLHQVQPRPRIVLLMRDITFGPEQTRGLWQDEGVYELLERVYDRVLIYGSRDIFDPLKEYAVSPVVAAKSSFCGYLTPPAPVRSIAEVRADLGATDRRLIVVSVGGGADGAPVLRAYLDGLRTLAPPDVVSFVVTGPLLPEEDQIDLERRAGGLPHLTLVPFAQDWIDLLRAADAVVCMGGYNAVCEAVYSGRRAIVVPRQPGPEEQVIRADRFARLGLVRVVPPEELTAARLWSTIREELNRGVSPGKSLGFDGSARIVDELAMMLPR